MRLGEISPLEVLDAHLAQIEELNPALNAIVVPDYERARVAARAFERGRTKGESTLPLHGLPFTVKEAIEAEGLPGCEASRLRPRVVGERDAVAVARLRAAGAILVGKTNISELSAFPDSVNLVYGATRNPVDATRSACGSSGGEGAAVGAGLSSFGIGSDYGGSIRGPAHFCGVAGIRPGLGRVPTKGHLPKKSPPFRHQWTTIGPLARTVDDLELVLSVLCGEPIGFELPQRVGIYRDSLERYVAAECDEAVERAAASLDCRVSDVTPPFQIAAERLFDAVSAAENRDIIDSLGPLDEASPQLRLIAAAVSDAPPAPQNALEEFRTLAAEATRWLNDVPVLLSPAAAEPAFELGSLREDVFDLFNHFKFASVLGLPAAVVPAGQTRDGLPIGVQVIGRRGCEAEVLGVARAIEAQVG